MPRWCRWTQGRQGTGYENLLLATGRWPTPFDVYLIRYRPGTEIPLHTDPVPTGRHYRLNLILTQPTHGGQFVCENPILNWNRVKLFRPDLCPHAVTKTYGTTRYVMSIGWVRP